jgi:3-deoxy-D-manno-octulosonic-acid transferase
VPDSALLVAAVTLYLDQPELRLAAGQAGVALVHDNHGALARTLEAMSRQLTVTAAAPAMAIAGDASRA